MKRNTGDKKREIRKEEIADDWCFICKDGGSLRVCDYKQCLKSYHSECVEEDESFMDGKSKWACGWHSCFNCNKSSKYHCFCCTSAVCQYCVNSVEFARIRDNKGFCGNCVKLALLGEANASVDSDGESVDFSNRETFECLFFEYWLIVKEKEKLTLEDLKTADNVLKNLKKPSTSHSLLSDSSESYAMSDSDTEDDDSEEGVSKQVKKRSKVEPSGRKRKTAKPKRKFIDWGSESLIQFLTSINKQTSEKLSLYEVTSIIGRYINEHNLFYPGQKRKILCDAKLEALFQNKTFSRNRLYDLLEPHFIENVEGTDDNLLSYFSDDDDDDDDDDDHDDDDNDDDDDTLMSTKAKRTSNTIEEDAKIEKVQEEAPKSRFASIVDGNIKIAFLMKSLMKQLLDNYPPETFDSKVIGCFVKIRSHPLDTLQKNWCQLVLITGVKRILQDDKLKVTLQASTGTIDIDLDIEKVLDVIFTEEELDDLRKRVEDGLIPRPTVRKDRGNKFGTAKIQRIDVVELEIKVKSLHVEITNHAIDKELASLVGKIDTSNEKGWRQELSEHLRRRELLKSPEERRRMVETIPRVVAAPAKLDMENQKNDT